MIATVNLEEIGLFRPATELDIVVGNIVFSVGDDDILYRKKIEEVLHPSDPWKAFCADDGCRYGLQDLYVVRSDWFTSKQKKKKNK
jgi:hypothetical protein